MEAPLMLMEPVDQPKDDILNSTSEAIVRRVPDGMWMTAMLHDMSRHVLMADAERTLQVRGWLERRGASVLTEENKFAIIEYLQEN